MSHHAFWRRAARSTSPPATSTAIAAARRRADARAVHLVGRIDHGRDDAGDAGGDQRVGARRRAAVVAARLEVDVDGRPAGVARGPQRRHLGVVAARPLVPALADDDAVADDHRAHHRVRRRGAPPVLGELGAAVQLSAVALVDHDAGAVGHRHPPRQVTVGLRGARRPEDRRPGDEDVGSGPVRAGDRGGVDAAVDLDGDAVALARPWRASAAAARASPG